MACDVISSEALDESCLTKIYTRIEKIQRLMYRERDIRRHIHTRTDTQRLIHTHKNMQRLVRTQRDTQGHSLFLADLLHTLRHTTYRITHCMILDTSSAVAVNLNPTTRTDAGRLLDTEQEERDLEIHHDASSAEEYEEEESWKNYAHAAVTHQPEILLHLNRGCFRIALLPSVCNTLQHTAKYCNALQHTAMHCNTL